MRSEQKTVAIGAASGVASMIALVTLLSLLFVTPDITTFSERLAFVLQLNVLAIIPLFIMLVAVGNSRFLSDAIDPTRHAENALQEINGRVVDNTLQQSFVYFVASLGLASVIPQAYLQVLIATTFVFMLARIVFWIGYRMHPLYRAPGMAGTAYLNLGMILATLWFSFLA